MMKPLQPASRHVKPAFWQRFLAGLTFSSAPALNFLGDTAGYRRYSQAGLFTLSALLCLVALYLMLDYQRTAQSLKDYQAEHPMAKAPTRSTKPDARLEGTLQLAQKTAMRLNTPWEPLFAALEQAQQGTAVHLLSIEPQTGRDELVLTGAVADFPTLLRYVAQLRQQAMLKEPTIINQRWQQDASTEAEPAQTASTQALLNFTLSLNWVQP
jgi:hypothetical protein